MARNKNVSLSSVIPTRVPILYLLTSSCSSQTDVPISDMPGKTQKCGWNSSNNQNQISSSFYPMEVWLI